MNEETIQEMTFAFALRIVDLYKFLKDEKKEYVLSKQLLESGTSIGANVQEAQAAQSRKDFTAKMSIASKEARETKYWLMLINEAGYFNNYDYKEIFSEIESIINILTKIVKTCQTKTQQP